MKPLQGVRILDLTNVLAGPFCCHQLAHMGADVIKVEVPGAGDLARRLGADPDLNAKKMGVSFLAQNSGKRSITINMKAASGKRVFKELAATARVVVENFRPGVMDRLGVGYDVLKAVKPNLIYCAISGFGQDGPLRSLPAYDQIIQGMSGVMSITGAPETAPCRVGYPVADTVGGMTAAFAIASALAAPREARGAFIDVSMLEAVMSTMGWVLSNHLVTGEEPQPMGNHNFTASPSGTFRTGDGLINIAANKQEQFEAAARVVGREELIADSRFSGRQARLENRAALTAELEAALAARSAADWQTLFNEAGVPAGRVMSVPEALAEPQIAERGMIARFEAVPGTDRAHIDIARPGVRLDGSPLTAGGPPPTLGRDTDAILAELGYSDGEISALRAEKAV